MIKALFFDLDGTLLNSRKEISSQTRLTLEACKSKGIRLFIATARPPLLEHMLSWDHETLSLFDGGSYYNGGCVKTSQYKEYVPVSDETVNGVIKLVTQYQDINMALQMEGEMHAFRFPLEDKSYRSWGVTFEDSLDLSYAKSFRTVKILVFYANLTDSVTPIQTELVSSLKEFCQNKAQFYLTDQGKCIQIIGASVNKYESIEKIRLSLNLTKDEIAVFGDDINDTEMLSAYGNSVAMGNADSQVKETAKHVTLDNNSDGIHHAVCGILHLV